nr:pentapeptide repeat-containing protein [Desulfobulbaceae bacterium]
MRFYQWGEKQTLCYLVYESNNDFLLFNNKGMQLYSFTLLEKGSTNFEEGISHTSSKTNANNSADEAIKDAHQPEKITITPKTTEDVQFIVRQTAQNCPGCNLAKARLAGQVLIGANLEGANLAEADLSNTVLRRANLRGANLYKTNLQDANLMGADLTGANLTEAVLTGALTQGAIGYTQ